MKSQKVFIGGWVDAKLKRRFLQELRRLNRRDAARITQSRFLELLLLESVKLRKQRANHRAQGAGPNT
jgi:hypothetical protein